MTSHPPLPLRALRCSIASPASPPHLVLLLAFAAARDATDREHAVQRPAHRGVLRRARWLTEGARARSRVRRGCAYARAVITVGALANTSAWQEVLYPSCLSKALQMRSRFKRCTSKSDRYCRTCRRFEPSAACGLLCQPRLPRRKKAHHVSRCGHAHHWGQDCCFVRALSGNWSEESGYT
ncbi:hypothetical protein EDB84DRAFT_176022 [Lactarius hengduanensis]|nr:hypothetical protein EDB84DRAFT_176022 [Lactarius hengduanensis]